ncbi:EutN/CcmL family microcompartment protein [Bdellovibrionota bacterium FG-2]
MIIAKVVSRLVATARLDSLPNRQLLCVQPQEGFGDQTTLVAIDTVQAGPGDTVLVMQEGTGARQAVLADPSQPLPAQMVIVGIVDQVHTIFD